MRICRMILLLLLQFTVALTVSLPSTFPPELSSHDDECRALLHFIKSFIISRNAYKASCDIFSPASYLKTAPWTKAADCFAWDGVACDGATRKVIGLDLSGSWLQGSIRSNSTLFLLRSLRKLNLAGNDFGGSQISSRTK
ncbi:hypothetical protein CRG98_002094 [Punica granatum]|uniref:Leucine-rich repeat-containing N-terminal plant-type domain-containing protein n=1 Tax=Punica granatum TaxID=22663 RepID=A0A2I0L9W9_PUNGR|nr:hypothetical protein CRG98_002094 [Punica granatum]